MRTRNMVWHEPRSVKVATKIAKDVLKENKTVRLAKRPCPVGPCKFKMVLVNSKSLWCPKCGLMIPSDSVYSVKTGRRVKF